MHQGSAKKDFLINVYCRTHLHFSFASCGTDVLSLSKVFWKELVGRVDNEKQN